jgi:hypothetical protein
VGERPFLGIFFECCRAYGRIYKRPDGAAYEGRCPRCRLKVRVPIAPGGTRKRFFAARPLAAPGRAGELHHGGH